MPSNVPFCKVDAALRMLTRSHSSRSLLRFWNSLPTAIPTRTNRINPAKKEENANGGPGGGDTSLGLPVAQSTGGLSSISGAAFDRAGFGKNFTTKGS